MSQKVVPLGLLKAPLANGVGRFIPQLQRVTLKLCKHSRRSHGLREYVAREEGLLAFARRHPATACYVKPRRNRPPLLVAEYLSGWWQWRRLDLMPAAEIQRWMEHLAQRNGHDIQPLQQTWRCFNPSAQGVWQPGLHRASTDPALGGGAVGRELAENWPHLHRYRAHSPDAQRTLLDLFEKQKGRLLDQEVD